MNCNECIYSNTCKQPNKNKPACIMYSRYNKAVNMACIQKRYKGITPDNIPIKDSNPEAYRKIIKYCNDILHYVEDGYSLYLYFDGTGTGKTTCAYAVLNKFIQEYVWKITKEGLSMDILPAYFIRCCDFQNKFSIQYKDSDVMAEYQSCKELMKNCKLLVIDDVAIRNCSDAFKSELYEVIDYRVGECLATIYTSNVGRTELADTLGERIQSRIYECCIPVEIKGTDHRIRR